jgi:hypothetical protein
MPNCRLMEHTHLLGLHKNCSAPWHSYMQRKWISTKFNPKRSDLRSVHCPAGILWRLLSSSFWLLKIHPTLKLECPLCKTNWKNSNFEETKLDKEPVWFDLQICNSAFQLSVIFKSHQIYWFVSMDIVLSKYEKLNSKINLSCDDWFLTFEVTGSWQEANRGLQRTTGNIRQKVWSLSCRDFLSH